MFVSALALSLALLQNPSDTTQPKVQQFGELLMQTGNEFKAQPEQSNFRAWVAEVKTVSGAITQVISVVETDLTKLENKPTPQLICDLHDRANRTRQGFSGQLFKTELTEINGRPMVVLVGSTLARDVTQRQINTYHVSAALSTETKAYEITWLTYNGGDDYTNAIKAVRSVQLKSDSITYQPKELVGTVGSYTLLGAPFKFLLNKPTTANTEVRPSEGQTGRYIGSISEPDWYATAEIALYSDNPSQITAESLLTALGYQEWLKSEPKPVAKVVEGVHVYERIKVSDKRHARIDIATQGKFICAVIVSADFDKPLPDRKTIALLP
jgi:hypothetical protein